MSKSIHQKQIKQREKSIKELRLRILNELNELRVQEDFLFALKKCSHKMGKSEKEVFQ
jgi:hypothetical protein